MSKIEVDQITQQSGSTLTVGGGACKTATVDATTVTLGRSGGTVSLASGASQSGFGRTGTVDWQTSSIKTATFTAANGEGYFANTSGGAFTMNLPAGTAGNIVSVVDYTNTFQTNALTISPNGSQKIGGTNADTTLSTEGQSVTFVYVDDTEGWKNVQDSTSNVVGQAFISATGGTETECGNFKIHTFTGPGTFCVSSLATDSANNVVDYLVVAGGGSGGVRSPGNANAGGGGGGMRYSRTTYTSPPCAPAHPIGSTTGITVTASAFPITVGGGGAGVAPQNPGAKGNDGSVSTFSTITSAGGGKGGAGGSGVEPGGSGGSGGGSGGGVPGGSPGGTGNTPPVTPPQGNPGGRGGATSPDQAAGGGGGAMSPGIDATPGGSGQGEGGAGGGIPTAFGSNGNPCGSFRYFSFGGGAGNSPNYSTGADGGAGSGGNSGGSGFPGNPSPADAAKPGGTNTGGGGGGAGAGAGHPFPSGSGGGGIVVIRYRFQ
jgi:hypothetical protein